MDQQMFISKIASMDTDGLVQFNPESDVRYIMGTTVDLYIPDVFAYPSTLDDELPSMVGKSSVNIESDGKIDCRLYRDVLNDDANLEEFDITMAEYQPYVSSATIHLPPYRHEQTDAIESEIDCGESFETRYGTTKFGVVTDAEDWGVMPHIMCTDSCSLSEALRVIRQAASFVSNHEYLSKSELRSLYAEQNS